MLPYSGATNWGHGYSRNEGFKKNFSRNILKPKFFRNNIIVTVFVIWVEGTELGLECNMGQGRGVEITTTFSDKNRRETPTLSRGTPWKGKRTRVWLMEDHKHQAEAFRFALRRLLILSKAEYWLEAIDKKKNLYLIIIFI